MQKIENLAELATWVGKEVGSSEWLLIDQRRIQLFADATGDQQWIHTDPERAQRESPYKTTIAHGYLTLSLLPMLFESCVQIDGIAMAVNYGLDRVRFPAPVPANHRVRGRLSLERLEPIAGGVQAHWAATVELEHGEKPVCVAQMVTRYYVATSI